MDNIVINWINAVSTSVIAIAAIFTGGLTFRLFRENRLLRRANTEPEVVAYLSPDDKRGFSLNFIIENIGQGTARNVRFAVHADIGDFEVHSIYTRFLEDREPFSVLKPNASLKFYLGSSRKILSEPRLKPFQVLVEYENLKGERRKQTYSLDASPFAGSDVHAPPEVEIAESLRDIDSRLRDLSNGLKRLRTGR